MYIILQQGKKIFIPNTNSVYKFLLDYNKAISENEIIKWLDSNYTVAIKHIEIKYKSNDFTVVSLTTHKEFTNGKFVSFDTAIKYLSNDPLSCNVKKYILQQKLEANIKLKFGVRDGKIVSIDEISESKKGLKCECYCPGCGMKLQAKIGNGKKQRHFAHNNASCNALAAHQSALHMLAKEILEKERKICLPPLTVTLNEIPNTDKYRRFINKLPEELTVKKSTYIYCDRVVLEKKLSDIIPDVVIETKGRYCLVEVAVTHFIDEEKINKIKKIGLSVVEIDLSSLNEANFSRDDIRKAIIDSTKFKKWIYNTKKQDAINWAKNEYDKLYSEIENKYLKLQEEQEKREKQKLQRKELANCKFKVLLKPENYQQALKQLRNDVAFMKAWKNRSFYKAGMQVPFYMDIPITGEMIFNCDRRIWQSAVFDKFIYNRKQDVLGNPTVSVFRICSWAKSYQNEFKLNWDLMPQVFFVVKNSGRERSLLFECVKQYLTYLSLLGFISDIQPSEADVLCRYKLTPPNKEKEMLLKTILDKIDVYSNDATDRIFTMLYPERVTITALSRSSEDWDDHSIKLRKTQRIESNKIKYQAGFEEVVSGKLFTKEEIVRDSFGYRWLICSNCGQIKREDEMASYSNNTGSCRECSRI